MRTFKRGDHLIIRVPVGEEDERIATMKLGRVAVFLEYVEPHEYARVAFYGDARGLTYLMHPESLQAQP